MSRRVKVFICAFVALQMLAPLWYYAARDDTHDERFAWRMFSSVRMLECQVGFYTGPARAPVRDLGNRFHEAWINLARRGRVEVITAMAKNLCEGIEADQGGEGGEAEVYAEYTCKTIDGTIERRGGSWNVCRLGTL